MANINNPIEVQKIEFRIIEADYEHRKAMMDLWKDILKLHKEGKLNDEEFDALSKRVHSKVTSA